MKKIVAINCSPRSAWNTATLIRKATWMRALRWHTCMWQMRTHSNSLRLKMRQKFPDMSILEAARFK